MLKPPAVVAACVALLLAASGCTHDAPKPNYSSVSTSPSESPTPSSSTATPNTTANAPPGSVRPTLPASAGDQDAAGALAYSAYFWRMLDWAYATNDASVLDGLFSPSCESCRTFRTSIATDVGAGYTLLGGRIGIQSVQAASLEGGAVTAQFAFDVAVSVDALEERATNGTVATSYPASASTQRTYLSWANNAWSVVNTAQVTG